MATTEPSDDTLEKRVSVYPGNCGFPCTIHVVPRERRVVAITLHSKCEQVRNMGGLVTELNLHGLFLPITRNPVYLAAEQAGCHPSCPVPVAVLKAVEVASGMAVPQEVLIRFAKPQRESSAQ